MRDDLFKALRTHPFSAEGSCQDEYGEGVCAVSHLHFVSVGGLLKTCKKYRYKHLLLVAEVKGTVFFELCEHSDLLSNERSGQIVA
jgi:hypothetical protein